MKLTIIGFSQEMALEYDLDVIDLLILQQISYAQSNPNTYKYLNETTNNAEAWISHAKLLEDLPILRITEGTLKNRLTELRKKELIVSTTKANPNLNGTKTFYAITEKTHEMMYTSSDDRCHFKMMSGGHFKMTSDNTSNTNIFSKLNISDNNKTISKDIVEETSNSTNSISQNSKDTKYNPILEIMDNNKYVSKTKKKNKYEQGMDIIDNYTNNDILKEKLVIYLKFRLENKEKPMYINQWKGIVAKLDTLASDLDTQVKIVQQSIDRGYLGFYPLTTYNKQPQKKFIDDQVTVKIENEDISNERF